MLCCCKLCDSPGIFAVNITLELNKRAFTTRLFAELGFLGEIVKTRVQIAFFCGFLFNFGLLDFLGFLAA